MAVAVTVTGCGGEKAPPIVEKPRPVKTMVVVGDVEVERTFPGTVQAAQRAELAFRVGGQLIERPVKNGDEVKRGQLLARIDPRDFEIAVDEAQAMFDKAEADLQRYRRLYENDAVPIADLELRRSQREVAKARLESAKLNLEWTELRAPFDGEIGEIYVENREDVRAKEPVMSLHDVSGIEINVNVPEVYRANFKANQGGRLTIWATFEVAPERRFDLELKEFASAADPKTQTYKATLRMDQPDGISLQPGMTALVHARVTMSAGEGTHDGYIVPARAVFTGDAGNEWVWVVNEETETVHQRAVRVGEVTGVDGIWVLEGIKPGDRIVVAGVNQLREGMQVRLMDE